MGKAEKLKQKILSDAEAEARKILEEGEAEARGIRDEAQAEADKATSQYQARAEADAAEHIRRQTSLRELEARKAVLAEKGRLIEEVFEKVLESLREKDLTIRKLQDAVTRRDSVNLALVQSLKGVLGNLDDEDIEISVEKGVVFISISDKLLFRSGSYNVTNAAKQVLGKVAKVVNNKPDFEFMVEGHTDNVPYRSGVLLDNWDLSVKRATSVVRVLQNDFGVDPARMTAAGRSYYIPLVSNDTGENRGKNRRTRIVVLPKLDQFYSMIEEGMEDPEINE